MNRRGNTFRIDYATIPKKPPYHKILDFCGDELGLSEDEVLAVQISRNLGCAFVKTTTLEIAQRVCNEHDNKHNVAIDGKNYPLRITLEDGAVEVKITDLSEYVTNDKITEYLQQFGEVIGIREERYSHPKFPNISTGVRFVRMVVQKNIESIVNIDGETTMLSYFGQRQTCRHCREFIHVGLTCIENRKLMVQKSYADALKKKPQLKGKPASMGASQAKNKPTTVLSATQSNKPEQPPTRRNIDKSLMPPPAAADIVSEEIFPSLPAIEKSSTKSANGSMTITPGQKPSGNNRVTRRTTCAADGNETDDSTTSSSSSRARGCPKNKKRRDDSDNEQEEKDEQ